ncbi:unnamed protein product [Bursaphelenchus okinawaensis]|uniref:Uncharacterized protein n=1 Tax=Bursaphelenchus okinawaensis TaxID=465554 RepID=A0A811KZ95_9BILA|nr:unnamed protein product [Bursaphelenchus okinawaensis]CAG9114724.1 unnamed protein product [Bursaphelenchus okinawaensis]
MDPFDKKILNQLKEEDKIKPKCRPKDTPRSKLDSGFLKMKSLDYGETCYHRCLSLSDTIADKLKFTKWEELQSNGVDVKCDVVEVQCTKENGNDKTYEFLHHQLVKRLSKFTFDAKKPDVYIFIIDYASMSHLMRALPKTLQYLTQVMGATVFPFNNKPYYDSKFNRDAILHGKKIQDTNISDVCEKESSFLLFLYKKEGYKVLVNDDSGRNNVRSCKYNDENVIDHDLSTFFTRLQQMFPESQKTSRNNNDFHSNIWDKYCYENHSEMFKYFEKFENEYSDEPKLAITRFSSLMHAVKNNLYMYDDDFLEFFKNMNYKFQESHIFLLGDRGFPVYQDETIKIDRLEDYNPALIYKPPASLLKNEKLVEQLNENSRQLVTHFDVYATLVDILENGPNFTKDYNFKSKPPPSSQQPTASSLLRPLYQPRTCQTLGLHYEACLCQNHGPTTTNLPNDLIDELAKTAVNYINNAIQETRLNYNQSRSSNSERDQVKNDSFDRYCAKLKVPDNFKPFAELYKGPYDEDNIDVSVVYRLTFKTTPGEGLYDPYLHVYPSGTIEVASPWFNRKNRDRSQIQCLQNLTDVENDYILDFCYCKDSL